MNGPLFLTGAAAAGGILALAALATAALGWAEWRRPERHWRGARILATLAAVGALALLALRPARPRNVAPANPGPVALWTGGPRPADEAGVLRLVPPDRRFRLPGAEAPEGTATVPDVGTLRRHVSDPGILHLLGEGLDAGSLGAWTGSSVMFHPGPDGLEPRFAVVHAPREVGAGEPFRVTGRVRGGRADPALKAVLEGPDPAVTATAPVASDGTFRLRLPGFPASGRFGWKLRLVGAGERLLEEGSGGVGVVPPAPPRVLVLEGSPDPDTAALQRWLGAADGLATVRTEIGRGRYRFTNPGPPGEFAGLDAALLDRFDLVIADASVLATLPAPDRGELRRAVNDRGLGLLIRGASPTGPGNELPPRDRAFFQPWREEPTGERDAVEAGSDRSSRLRWIDGAGEESAPEEPVPVARAARIAADGVDGVVILVRDGTGRAVAARVGRGRGRVGLTLARDTARWRRTGRPEAFASFWSALIGELAAAGASGPGGRWALAGEAADGPAAWVDAPVELRWQRGGGGAVLPPAEVMAEEAPAEVPPTSLTLAPDPWEPTRGTARFWPRHAGWHRVRSVPDGPPMDFYVAPANDWPGVRAWSHREATFRYLSRSEPTGLSGHAPERAGGTPVESGVLAEGLFLVFVAATGLLWAEGRRGARGLSGTGVQTPSPAGVRPR